MQGRQFNAADRIFDVDEAPGLSPLAVDGQRVADGGLDDEPVKGGAEHFVVVKAVDQYRVSGRLLRVDAVDDTLV